MYNTAASASCILAMLLFSQPPPSLTHSPPPLPLVWSSGLWWQTRSCISSLSALCMRPPAPPACCGAPGCSSYENSPGPDGAALFASAAGSVAASHHTSRPNNHLWQILENLVFQPGSYFFISIRTSLDRQSMWSGVLPRQSFLSLTATPENGDWTESCSDLSTLIAVCPALSSSQTKSIRDTQILT